MQDFSNSPLRIGVIGAGNWAKEAHVPAFRLAPATKVVAICDVDGDRAATVAAQAAIPAFYADVREMLEAEKLDAVSVVTPDDAHVAPVIEALQRGLHVLCEKPLATTVEDAAMLARRGREAGVVTRMGFTMRAAPAMLQLRSLVAGGAVGRPHLLQAFQQNGQFLDPSAPFHWKMDGSRTGGGAIVEYGIHTLDLARWIMGEATGVSATSLTQVAERPGPGGRMAPIEVDDATAWLMEFPGAIATCHAGWATAGRPPGVEIRVFGSEGAVRCLLSDDLADAQGLWLAGRDGAFAPLPVSAPEDVIGPWWTRFPALLVREFVAAIRGQPGEGADFDDGLQAQVLLEAVQRAAADRRWIEPAQPRPVTQS
ncbi:MAG: Gfo/Idh/MocA family protein [Thermomicrobiales bacterium]